MCSQPLLLAEPNSDAAADGCATATFDLLRCPLSGSTDDAAIRDARSDGAMIGRSRLPLREGLRNDLPPELVFTRSAPPTRTGGIIAENSERILDQRHVLYNLADRSEATLVQEFLKDLLSAQESKSNTAKDGLLNHRLRSSGIPDRRRRGNYCRRGRYPDIFRNFRRFGLVLQLRKKPAALPTGLRRPGSPAAPSTGSLADKTGNRWRPGVAPHLTSRA